LLRQRAAGFSSALTVKGSVTIELRDEALGGSLTPEELRLELACALYTHGRIAKVSGSRLAGVDFFAFQHALPNGTSRFIQKLCWLTI
jgi:predicted HTH domain antitoxin